jgi:hypothetical protein
MARAALWTLALAGVAAWPVRELLGDAGLRALAWAACVAFLGACAGRLPRLLIPQDRPEAPVQAAMAGFGVRLLTTAVLAFVAITVGRPHGIAFALSVTGLYLVLLVLEVRDAVREIADVAPATRPPAGAA